MLKFDIFDLILTSGTSLDNECWQSLSMMKIFESLVCIKINIEVIMVCHFHSELFEFEQCVSNWVIQISEGFHM